MGAFTQRLNKEVVTFVEVEQIVAHKEENEHNQFILVSSNAGADKEESLLHAKKDKDLYNPIAIEVGDNEDDVGLTISISVEQALNLGESLVSMAKFLMDESKYTEVK